MLFYRGGLTLMPRCTARDVLAYEQEVLGNDDVRVLSDNLDVPADSVQWLTLDPEVAHEYDEYVINVYLEHYEILAADNDDGFLVREIIL